MRLWDVTTGKELHSFEEADAFAFFRDDRRILIGGSSLHLLDTNTWELTHEVHISRGEIHSVAISADGRRAVTCSKSDDAVLLWELPP